jgi:flagellar L-ring protein precursor FlgH
MNRGRLEDESELSAAAGSLWVMEGQGAYLFAQNRQRIVGDILPVRIEGEPKQQLQSKARVISRLVDRLENPRRESNADVANRQPASAEPENPQAAPASASTGAEAAGAGTSGGAASAPGAEARSGASGFAVGAVPTRIIEQLRDGSYRVRGTQPFMIGKREYRVIVTGIVRPEDSDDAGIDGSKLLDSQFDIVSAKRSTAQ